MQNLMVSAGKDEKVEFAIIFHTIDRDARDFSYARICYNRSLTLKDRLLEQGKKFEMLLWRHDQ